MKIPFKGFRHTGKIGIVGKWKYTPARNIFVNIPQYWVFYYESTGKKDYAPEKFVFTYKGKPLKAHLEEAQDYISETLYKGKGVILAQVTKCGGDVIVRR